MNGAAESRPADKVVVTGSARQGTVEAPARPGTEPAREKPALTIHQVNDDQG
ncbi:hypothetical protein [Streptomyces sp. NPDC016172]|uniref:hypothetical protein n=1 Tax=Streptomyces sp. NPDC016172 TaxID=3364964 RepID=UPI0036F5CD6F